MDPYRTEEDQIRALKQWWESNGSSTLIGVGLAMAILFGWQWWQQRQQSAAEQASVLYQQLLQAVENSATDEVQRTTAEHLAGELLKIGSAPRLGDHAELILARIAVEKNDLAAAGTHLQAVLERNPDTARGGLATRLDALLGHARDAQLGALARVRLARVQFAAGQPDAALATLEAAGGDDFLLQRHELRGDILVQRGERADALEAYREALAAAGNRVSPLLQMKLRELELGATTLVAAPAPATTDTGVQP